MGTKMECENYSPGYFFTRRNHLNEVTQPSWSLCHEQHTMPNRHLIHGGFSRSTVNTISNGGGGYLDYDTQVLKQTMLTHEATFRNQVHELHRVYRIQREMMDELKKVDRFSRLRPCSSHFGALLDNRDKEDDDDVVEIKKEIVTLPFFGTKTPSNKVAAANVKLISLGTYRESGSGLVDLNEPVSEFCDKDEDGDVVVLSNGPSVKLDLGSQTPRKQFWKQDEHQVIQQTTQNLPSHRSFLNGFHRYDGSGIPSNSQWPPSSSSSSFEISSSQKVENYSRTATRITPPTHAGDDNPIGFRNQIDLNSVAEIPDQTPSDQTSSRRFVLDIDLEVPAQPEESFRINQHDPVENPESESNGNQENGGVDDDEIIKFTAGIIISMFSDIPKCSVAPSPTTRTRPSDTNYVDSLRWFADVVISSNANEPKIAPLVTSDVGDGMDFFESMTLKLTDSQSEHSTQKPCRRDAENGEESGFASMLLTMGRKCQGKKRRQKKDFQKDILPGLSSLSKHEVTEDLQSFEKMMRASGLSWLVGGARRNGRQRRCRPRAVSAATTVQISSDPQPQPMQSNNANVEVGIDKGDLIGGWGRTRRCRRQRWASSSLAAAAAAGSLS